MRFHIPSDVIWIMQQITSQKEEVFLVGGCVRDLLLNRPVHDYDMTTSMPAEAMISLFSQLDCNVVPTGLKHGTVTIIRRHQAVEITTYRTESSYLQHRRPANVQFTRSLKEDLKRRDFTINAMAYHPDHGIIDCFHSQEDLKQNLIRGVGNSEERFTEDALRIMRAIRFHCQLSFSLHPQTHDAIIKNSRLLVYISKERIRDEFNKILLTDKKDLLQFLKDMHVLPYILPEIEIIYDHEQHSPWHLYDVFKHTDIALNHAENASLRVRLAIVLHDIGKPHCQTFENGIAHYKGHASYSAKTAEAMLSSLRYAKKTIHEICLLIRFHDTRTYDRKGLRALLYAMNNDFSLVEDLLTVQLCDNAAKVLQKVKSQNECILQAEKLLLKMKEEHDIFCRKDLRIDGNDLKTLGFEKQEIGTVLSFLIDQVICDPAINTKEKLTALAISYRS